MIVHEQFIQFIFWLHSTWLDLKLIWVNIMWSIDQEDFNITCFECLFVHITKFKLVILQHLVLVSKFKSLFEGFQSLCVSFLDLLQTNLNSGISSIRHVCAWLSRWTIITSVILSIPIYVFENIYSVLFIKWFEHLWPSWAFTK